ncbi:MAG: C4-dicarboxylate ABC transporter permease [Gammaproteobacteria bacterium]|nr:MAG: C4-dicarboxylate ABC transporter permease [Gammaproteobacteria bacterium]
MTAAIIGFLVVIALVFLRIPIGFAMGIVGAVGFAALNNWRFKSALGPAAHSIWETIQKTELSIIPLFILMGMLIARSGMAHDLYRAGYTIIGRFRGGLAMSTILASGGFSAISGSSLATVATMAEVSMPSMRKFGYHDSLSTASIAAGGTLGILIPPSVLLVIYAFMTEQSVAKMFLAGVLPGILGILLYIGAVAATVILKPEMGPAGEKFSAKEVLQASLKVTPLLMLFLMIFGGLYFKLYAADEAAAVGAVGTLVLSILFKRFTWAGFRSAVVRSVLTSTSLFVILIGSAIFSRFIVRTGLPNELLNFVLSNNLSPYMVVVAIIGIYLLLGAVFESLSMVTLTVPIFAPVIAGLTFFEAGTQEMNLIWFGIIVVIATEISLLTPPVGLNVFVLRGQLPDVSTGTIFRGVTPFWIADMLRIFLIVFVPWLALGIPQAMG